MANPKSSHIDEANAKEAAAVTTKEAKAVQDQASTKELCTRLCDATTTIASRLQYLSDKIVGGMNDQDASTVKAGLREEIDRLKAMGTDPNDPVKMVPKM